MLLLSALHILADKVLLALAPHLASRCWSLSLSLDLVLVPHLLLSPWLLLSCSLLLPCPSHLSLLPQDHWILAKASSVGLQHMPSSGYGLLIHRYPILRCGVHVPVVTIYVVVKAACFTSPSRAQPDPLSIDPSLESRSPG